MYFRYRKKLWSCLILYNKILGIQDLRCERHREKDLKYYYYSFEAVNKIYSLNLLFPSIVSIKLSTVKLFYYVIVYLCENKCVNKGLQCQKQGIWGEASFYTSAAS